MGQWTSFFVQVVGQNKILVVVAHVAYEYNSPGVSQQRAAHCGTNKYRVQELARVQLTVGRYVRSY